MIPRRTAHALETSLFHPRQSLPRPSRYTRSYASSTRPLTSPALSQASAPQVVSQAKTKRKSTDAVTSDMNAFLRRDTSYTILPTPLPSDRTSATNSYYFIDTPTQDQLSVIDACLHNLVDVPRAQQVFERLRQTKPGDPSLETRLYNLVLQSYINMASTKEVENRVYWLEEAWYLFNAMESGKERAQPNHGTYALMVLALLRFNPTSMLPVDGVTTYTAEDLLNGIVDRKISIPHVVSDRCFDTDEDASEAVRMLSKAAVNLNISHVVSELGQVQAVGGGFGTQELETEETPDPLPVTRKVVDKEAELDEEGNVITPTLEHDEVPFNLANLRKYLAQVAFARRVLPDDVVARQKLLEESVYDVAAERLQHQHEQLERIGVDPGSLGGKDLQGWMWEWHLKLEARLRQEIKDLQTAEEEAETRHKGRKEPITPLHPFLSVIKPEKLSLITIMELMRLQGSGGVSDGMKTARALLYIGKAVDNEYKAEMCRKNKIAVPSFSASARLAELDVFSRGGYKDLHARRVAARRFMEDAEEWTSEWSQTIRLRIGSILVNCLMEEAVITRTGEHPVTGAEISEEQPAFYHSYEYLRGQKLGVIRLNPEVASRIAKDRLSYTLHPRHLPMLTEPRPWIDVDNGAYLYNKTNVMRFKESHEQLAYLKNAAQKHNLEFIFAGLDTLGATPWRINKKIFDVVLQVWNTGERFAKIPPAEYDAPEPAKPANVDENAKGKNDWIQKKKSWIQDKDNNHSNRCNVNYKIEIARAFLNDKFYLPHNVDFRGRAYPIPPHLNHIGDDLSRGLMQFWESRPLGERGLRWLKIHLSNVYGFDKANFDERVQFVEDHLEDIYDSAEKPLEGKRWWMDADDPWQCLATCMELRAALTSPNPLEFESCHPVHQDGTCNGLQHYAALGGDSEGAQQVNLSSTERPSDVYTYVANACEDYILKDIEKGEGDKVKWAKVLSGQISRKVVKQTVMTTVYGVTFIGAREQIQKQLRDKKLFQNEDAWLPAAYLARVCMTCIGNLFSGAQLIQLWLSVSARLITKSIPEDRLPEALAGMEVDGNRKQKLTSSRLRKEQMQSVIWTTALGLPVVQPYRKTKRRQIQTQLQTVYISDPNASEEVNSLKQASAFPPNFVHSLDATHMMLTAIHCRTKNITFAAVHDSYWTHASTVDDMSAVIRDTFIGLHESDVLQALRNEFVSRYRNHKIPLMVLRGSSLTKALAKLGVRVKVTEKQSKALGPNWELADLTEHEDESDVTDAAQAYPGLELADVESLVQELKNVKSEEEELAEVEAEIGLQAVDAEIKKRGRKRRTKVVDAMSAEDAAKALAGKFVNLVDLLPPLPEKGDFNVADIKQSQYFFS